MIGVYFAFASATIGVEGVLEVMELVGDGNASTPVGEHGDVGAREHGEVDAEYAMTMQFGIAAVWEFTRLQRYRRSQGPDPHSCRRRAPFYRFSFSLFIGLTN
jgi:hypothetical protein